MILEMGISDDCERGVKRECHDAVHRISWAVGQFLYFHNEVGVLVLFQSFLRGLIWSCCGIPWLNLIWLTYSVTLI